VDPCIGKERHHLLKNIFAASHVHEPVVQKMGQSKLRAS